MKDARLLRIAPFAALLALATASAACAGAPDDPGILAPEPAPAPTGPDPAQVQADRLALRALIMGIDPAPLPGAVDPHEMLPAPTGNEVKDDTLMQCTYHHYAGTELYETLVSFDPNADSLWPGSVVQSKDLPEGLLAPVALPRAAGTVTLTNAILGDTKDPTYSRIVTQPTQATMQAAVHDILRAKSVNLAAKADYVSEQVHSLTEFALKAGISVDWMTGNVKASFDGDWQRKRASFVVKFTQAYYTVSFSAPSEPEAFFADSVKVDDAHPYMSAQNPPGYVASVTYGRVLFVKVESDDSETDVKAAIDAVFNAGTVGGQVDVASEYKEIMGRATVTVFALGGSPNDAIEIMTSGPDRADKIKAYFERGANYTADSPGVPIAYTVRRLKDNAAIKVASTLDYSVPECAPEPSTVKIHFDGIDVPENGDSLWFHSDITYKISINGTIVTQGSRSGVADGDFLSINEDHVLTINKTNLEKVTISAQITEDDDDSVYPSRAHTYYLDAASKTGQWTQLGPNAIEQSNGLDARLKYTIDAN